MNCLAKINDKALIQKIDDLAANERRQKGEFLLHLNEMSSRRLHEGLGYPSLFKYLVGKMNYSEPTAAKRIAAAKLVGRLPEILPYINTGKLHLSGIYQIGRHLQNDNWQEVCEACTMKSKAWIEEYVARKFQVNATNARRDVVRIIAPIPTVTKAKLEVVEEFPTPILSLPAIAPKAEPKKEDDLVRISTTLDRKTLQNLERLQEIMGTDGFAEVIAKATDHYLKKIDPNREPRKIQRKVVAPKATRFVSKTLRHELRKISGGQCCFVSKDGNRCQERRHLQVDHIMPLAKGRLTVLANLREVCAVHNQFLAREEFGEGFMKRKVEERRSLSLGKVT